MLLPVSRDGALVAATALLLLVIGLTGCTKKDEGGAAAAAPVDPAKGKALLASNGCDRCHAGGGRAPDLTHAGADASHTAAWIAEHIKNPKSHNPGSRMPGFEGRMADADIQTLAAYLASLK